MILSLTEAEAFDSMFDSKALPGSAFTEVAREFGEKAEIKTILKLLFNRIKKL